MASRTTSSSKSTRPPRNKPDAPPAGTLHAVVPAHLSETKLLDLWVKLPGAKKQTKRTMTFRQKRDAIEQARKTVRDVLYQVDQELRVPTPKGHRLRIELMDNLVQLTGRISSGVVPPRPTSADNTMTTSEAAELLGYSRPHVAMLVDEGRLKGATTSAGGHRRIPRSAVLAYKQAQTPKSDADYKKAARDAGMYAISDEAYVKGMARRSARKTRKKPARTK